MLARWIGSSPSVLRRFSEKESWEHKAIVTDLIPALKGDQIIPGVPIKWDRDRFDVVLRFDSTVPDAPWSFRQLSPRLMSGDSDAPFS